MQNHIGQNWSMFMIRGIVALLFGVAALVFPFATLASLVILAASFMFVDGIFAFFSMFTRRETGTLWWSTFFEALAGLVFSLALLMWPSIALLTFLYLLAAWSIVSGIFEIVTAFRLRKIIEREWALAFAGLMSLAFGVAVVVFPGLGLMATSWMLGGYAIIFGILLINTSTHLKRLQESDKTGGMASPKLI